MNHCVGYRAGLLERKWISSWTEILITEKFKDQLLCDEAVAWCTPSAGMVTSASVQTGACTGVISGARTL